MVVIPVKMLTAVIDSFGQIRSTKPITNDAMIVIIEKFLILINKSFIMIPSYFFMYLMTNE